MEDRKDVFSLIVTIVNRGYSEEVMDAARDAGAKGGTILYAHGAGLHEAETFFGISIHPEKELVLVLAANDIRPVIMQSIVKRVGMTSEGAGITFSLPVTNVAGIAHLNNFEEKKEE
ncbi:MAG: P-II family nitrogen regulator [Oscillospiraceae bacterium]|nr:P-II family nitrogen regulator [Oscillospiraceae bacterium]